MIPAPHDIVIKRGDTFSLFARARDKVWDAGTGQYIAGPYKDLTGWVGLCQLRATEDSATVIATPTIVIGNQVTALGSFFMNMTDAETGAITALEGVYDIQFTTPAAEVYTYVGGIWTLSKDVSRLP